MAILWEVVFILRLLEQNKLYNGYIFIYKEDYIKTKPKSTIEKVSVEKYHRE